MTTLPDLLYVALYAVAMPLWDYLVSWPALHRQLQADPARARKRLWAGAIGYPWALVAVGAAVHIGRIPVTLFPIHRAAVTHMEQPHSPP